MPDDEVGAGVHRSSRKAHHIAAVLTEEALLPGLDVLIAGALGAGVHRDHDDVRARSVALLISSLAAPMSRRSADQR